MLLYAVILAIVSELIATTSSPPPSATIRAGTLLLHRCTPRSEYYCGSITRALDPAGAVRGTVEVGFTFLPHADLAKPSAGTIVAAEGGPGYPSSGSSDSYRALFGPLLHRHDLLLMDDRGTGRSGAVDCRPLQSAPVITLRDVTRCGAALGKRADLYGTALAADDLGALLRALRVLRVDLYGDSYGTLFVQVFAARHPERVRSLSIDGAYPAAGDDPWYPSYGPAIRHAFDIVCRRSPQCNAQHGTALSRIERLLRTLRHDRSRTTPAKLAFVMASAGLNPIAYRELDAAARAYLSGDRVPLNRLVREAYDYQERNPGGVGDHSQGLFAAASCQDNPQVYDMRLAPAQRRRAWEKALARQHAQNPHLYTPFIIDEFLAIPLDFSYVPMCQSWPVASAAHPAGTPISKSSRMPDVPTLVLGGELDTITTPRQGDAAARLFKHAHRVIVSNTGHVTAVRDPYDCASRMVRTLIASHSVDSRCAQTIPPLRLVPSFSLSSSQVQAAAALPGNSATLAQLRAVADAVLAASDALARASALGVIHGDGLRGGGFTAGKRGNLTRIRMDNVAWTDDVPVYGKISFDAATGKATALLRIAGAASGNLSATWDAYNADARTVISGSISGNVVRATMPAL